MKRPDESTGATSSALAAPDARRYRVELHPQVIKAVAERGGVGSAVFRPTIGALIDDLEVDPKRYPKKHGRLKTARAAPLHYSDGVTWRAVYIVDDAARTVFVIALGPHDTAYQQAARRILSDVSTNPSP